MNIQDYNCGYTIIMAVILSYMILHVMYLRLWSLHSASFTFIDVEGFCVFFSIFLWVCKQDLVCTAVISVYCMSVHDRIQLVMQ